MIQKFMTPMPHTIGEDLPIKTAMGMMREHHIRHLPVQNGGRLVGVLTDRDIKVAQAFDGAGDLKVSDVMMPDPYIVDPDAPLNTVVERMAEHKYGCAIVVQGNGKVVGIFTAVDGLRVLGEELEQHFKARA